MSQFIPLTIKSIQPQTEQAICIAFDLAPEQMDAFQYQPGQHLTIRYLSDDGELRRCYSICSDTQEDMSIAIKKLIKVSSRPGPMRISKRAMYWKSCHRKGCSFRKQPRPVARII